MKTAILLSTALLLECNTDYNIDLDYKITFGYLTCIILACNTSLGRYKAEPKEVKKQVMSIYVSIMC